MEEDVLTDQSRSKRARNIEKNQTDIEAAVRDTQLACHMASGQYNTQYAIGLVFILLSVCLL